jgi:alanine dehydrogenase
MDRREAGLDIGVPVERSASERRVALAPAGVERLVRGGNRVFVERSAGESAAFTDDEYVEAGAQLSYSTEEVYGRSDLLLKVLSPTPEELELVRDDSVLMCFLLPGVMSQESFRELLDRRIYGVAMEMIVDPEGTPVIKRSMSEIAGPMSIQIAANLLQSSVGGRGMLLGGAPGIPPAVVVVLGAGHAGTSAARVALGNGAQVVVLDRSHDRLREIETRFGPAVTTMYADMRNIGKAAGFADVMIGAAAVSGGRTPIVVTESMVKQMKPGSVIIDLSIDRGGCVEGIRPTSFQQPTYVRHDVVHYAVPNTPANVARTSTYVLSQVCWRYVHDVADVGILFAVQTDPGFRRGLVTAAGKCLHSSLAELFDVPFADAAELDSGIEG